MREKMLGLLDLAKKKVDPKEAPLEYTEGPAIGWANFFLGLLFHEKEIEEKKGAWKTKLLDEVGPWQLAKAREKNGASGTVNIATTNGTLKMMFQQRYAKITLKQEEGIAAIVGPRFKELFRHVFKLSVKKAIADDHEKLEKMVNTLAKLVTKEKFAEWFEVDISLAPTESFHKTKHLLEPKVLADLEEAGVDQVVVLQAAK
jgi:hypothetical protein